MKNTEVISVVVQFVAVVGGLIAAFKWIAEMKQNRIQRHLDWRWKQANTAREMLNDMLASAQAHEATLMMENSGETYRISATEQATISFDDVRESLRSDGVHFSKKEQYIRDCADAFLFHVELMEQAIRNELITFKDIKFPMENYLAALRKNDLYHAYTQYTKANEYKNADRFFGRFQAKLKTSKTMS